MGFFPMKMWMILMKLQEAPVKLPEKTSSLCYHILSKTYLEQKSMLPGFCPFKWLKQVPLHLVVYATENKGEE